MTDKELFNQPANPIEGVVSDSAGNLVKAVHFIGLTKLEYAVINIYSLNRSSFGSYVNALNEAIDEAKELLRRCQEEQEND